jgi:hypothetical protein
MKDILIKIYGLLMIFILISCGDFEAILETKKSFDKNRNEYEKIVMNIKQHRDKLIKTKHDTRQLDSYNDVLSKLGKEFGNPEIRSSNPLVISFIPRSYSYTLVYAETSKSVEFIYSNPLLLGHKHQVAHLEGKWYLIKIDEVSASPLF